MNEYKYKLYEDINIDIKNSEAYNWNEKFININEKYTYKIEFIGEIEDNCSVKLYIISYCDNKKLYGESIKLNTSKVITNVTKCNHIKLAVKVSNIEKVKINTIKIYRKLNVYFVSQDKIKSLKLYPPICIKDLNIACIFDDFTTECYKDMVKLIKIKPDSWKIDLTINKPHALIVESAWHGNNNSWDEKIQYVNEYNTKELKEVINWCRENNVPTVFWNKEDPAHFEQFILTAKLFDYVFTTDECSIEKYIKELKHNNVYALPFAAQPKIHNPIKIYDKRIEKAFFSGSYYTNKFPKRKTSLENILKLAIENIGLDIYDRNYYLNSIQYRYPLYFKPYIKGYLCPNDLEKCNKGYKIMLNVNSVTNSPTMFSRRVFEGLACGTPVISSYSLGINNMFKDIVVASDDLDELKDEFIRLKGDNYYDKKVVKGIRAVLRNHTYKDRILYMLDKIGISASYNKPSLSIISSIESLDELEKAKIMYYSQTYYYKKLYLIIKNEKLNKFVRENNQDNKIILLENKDKNINSIIQSDYIGIMSVNNYYGKYYFEDLMNSTLYSDAEFIGKKSFFKLEENIGNTNNIYIVNEGMSFQYVDILDLDKCIFKSSVVKNKTINELIEHIEVSYIDKFKFGCRYLSIDKFNFIESVNKAKLVFLNSIDCMV